MQWLNNAATIALKVAAIVGIGVFLYLYAGSRHVGRYLYIASGELEYVMDTTTGIIYQNGYFMNHITGKESGGKPRK